MEIFGIELENLRGAVALAKDTKGLVKEAVDIVQGLGKMVGSAKKGELQDGVVDSIRSLTNQLLLIQIKQLELVNLVAEAQRQTDALETRGADLARYTLHQFPSGAIVYALRADQAQGEPVHYLCQPCIDDGKKSVLQPYGAIAGQALECPRCKTTYRSTQRGPGRLEY